MFANYTITGWLEETVVEANESNLSVIPVVTQCIRKDPWLSQQHGTIIHEREREREMQITWSKRWFVSSYL